MKVHEILSLVCVVIIFICLLVQTKRLTLYRNQVKNLQAMCKSYHTMYKNAQDAYNKIAGTAPVYSPTRVIKETEEVNDNAEL